MVTTKKFSEFKTEDWEAGVETVGLSGGENAQYLVNLQFSATGNTAARPSTPDTPTIRYNTDTNDFEFWDGTEWKTLSSIPSISTTDNAIARFDGTNGDLQNSGVIIDDFDNVSGVNQLNVDNLQLLGNTISSTDTAGDINVTPDTTGDLVLDGLKWPQADGSANTFLTTDGAGQLSFSSGSFPISGGTLNHMLRSDGSNWVESTNLTLDSADNMAGIASLTFDEIAIPSAPAADKLILFSADEQGVTELFYKDSTDALINLAGNILYVVKNTSGALINRGDAVFVSGATGSNATIDLARADDPSTMEALGLAFEDIADNGFGRVLSNGILDGIDTSSFSEGNTVFVSASTAGNLTNTKPAHPNLQQKIGVVLVSGVGNGEIEVDTSAALGDDVGTRQNTYSIGDATAGTKTLAFVNANTLNLSATPTAGRTVTIPDATTTLVGTDTTDTLTNKTMGDELDAGSNKIINVTDPTVDQDAATKKYVDDNNADLHFLQSVRVASTGNFASTYDNGTAGVGATLTANSNGAATVDGIALSLNDRVLRKDQSNAFENGIYKVTQVGDGSNPAIYTRATDFDEPDEIVAGDLVTVREGSQNEKTAWLQTADVATIGTDPITFVQFIADLSNVVTLDGTQTITGAKTFNDLTLGGAMDAGSNNLSNVATLTVNDAIQHTGDINNQLVFGTDTQDFQTGGSSRIDISNSGVRFGGAGARINSILDEDDMSSDSATDGATQQSIKAYVDNAAGKWELISTIDFTSAQSTVDITNLSTTHFAYKFILEWIRPVSDGVNAEILLSTDNGATFITTAGAYRYQITRSSTSTVSSVGASTTSIVYGASIGNVSDEGVWGEFTLINPAHADYQTQINFVGGIVNLDPAFYYYTVTAARENVESNNAIRFRFASGDIQNMSMKVYGIRA